MQHMIAKQPDGGMLGAAISVSQPSMSLLQSTDRLVVSRQTIAAGNTAAYQ